MLVSGEQSSVGTQARLSPFSWQVSGASEEIGTEEEPVPLRFLVSGERVPWGLRLDASK